MSGLYVRSPHYHEGTIAEDKLSHLGRTFHLPGGRSPILRKAADAQRAA